jgi:hypothetical protein
VDLIKGYSLEKTNDLLEDIRDLPGNSDTSATIFNVTLGPVDTEQSQALPSSTKGFLIRTRGKSELKLAYTLGDSGVTYVTIPRNATFTDNNFYSSQTLYFQSPQTGDVVEIVAYT